MPTRSRCGRRWKRWPLAAGAVGWWSCSATCSSWARSPTRPTARPVARWRPLGADELLGVGPRARLAVHEAQARGLGEARSVSTFEDTVAHLLKRLAPGDVVLVKASRGMRLERVVDALMARLLPAAGPETA